MNLWSIIFLWKDKSHCSKSRKNKWKQNILEPSILRCMIPCPWEKTCTGSWYAVNGAWHVVDSWRNLWCHLGDVTNALSPTWKLGISWRLSLVVVHCGSTMRCRVCSMLRWRKHSREGSHSVRIRPEKISLLLLCKISTLRTVVAERWRGQLKHQTACGPQQFAHLRWRREVHSLSSCVPEHILQRWGLRKFADAGSEDTG